MGKLDLRDYPCEERKQQHGGGGEIHLQWRQAANLPRAATHLYRAGQARMQHPPRWVPPSPALTPAAAFWMRAKWAKRHPGSSAGVSGGTGWKEAIRLPSAGEGNWGEELWSSVEKATAPAGGRAGREPVL